jgi:anti-sigma B factor antagonist
VRRGKRTHDGIIACHADIEGHNPGRLGYHSLRHTPTTGAAPGASLRESNHHMNIQERTFGSVLVVSPTGRIDHATSDVFRKQLEALVEKAAKAGNPIVIDLAGVEYISSAGLRCFMLAAKLVKSLDGIIVIAALQPVVKEIFEISRFTLVFELFPTVRDAIAKKAPPALAQFDGA